MTALPTSRPRPRSFSGPKKRCSPVFAKWTQGALGVRTDADSGLAYMRQRWYDPSCQRFISRDPIGLRGGEHLYRYCANNPARHVDPSGQKICLHGSDENKRKFLRMLEDATGLELGLDFLNCIRILGRKKGCRGNSKADDYLEDFINSTTVTNIEVWESGRGKYLNTGTFRDRTDRNDPRKHHRVYLDALSTLKRDLGQGMFEGALLHEVAEAFASALLDSDTYPWSHNYANQVQKDVLAERDIRMDNYGTSPLTVTENGRSYQPNITARLVPRRGGGVIPVVSGWTKNYDF